MVSKEEPSKINSAGDAVPSAGDALGGSAGDAHEPVSLFNQSFDLKGKSRACEEKTPSAVQQKAKTPAAKKPDFELPDWLNQNAWSEFEQSRKEIKKPLTDLGRTKAVKILEGHSYNDQQTIID